MARSLRTYLSLKSHLSPKQVIQSRQYQRECQKHSKGRKKVKRNITTIQPHDLKIRKDCENAIAKAPGADLICARLTRRRFSHKRWTSKLCPCVLLYTRCGDDAVDTREKSAHRFLHRVNQVI